jgi:hypothetical protein
MIICHVEQLINLLNNFILILKTKLIRLILISYKYNLQTLYLTRQNIILN